jgi:hypothetical protein
LGSLFLPFASIAPGVSAAPAGAEACVLLSPAEIAGSTGLSVTEGKPNKENPEKLCRWSSPERASVGIGIIDDIVNERQAEGADKAKCEDLDNDFRK